MIITPKNKKRLLEFLIDRWMNIVAASSAEIIYAKVCQIAEDNKLAIPDIPIITISKPSRQIDIIKHRIVEILPEADFIKYIYESPAPLSPPDFIEIYAREHIQCAGKVQTLIEKLNIT